MSQLCVLIDAPSGQVMQVLQPNDPAESRNDKQANALAWHPKGELIAVAYQGHHSVAC